jgi:hypothetical protein
MFCSWKKSPAAPCSCAFQLQGPLAELLNHLCGVGPATLVLRQQGLSLAKSTSFGLCVAYGEGDWQIVKDRLSGLETDMRRPMNAYLMTGFGDRWPRIALGEPGRPVHLSIRLDRCEWESALVREMIVRFGGAPLDCLESRRLGAGAWLDEWERPSQSPGGQEAPDETRRRLLGCDELEVEAGSGGHRTRAVFEPSFVDFAGSVVRIADRARRHVVHVDVNDPGFKLAIRRCGNFRRGVMRLESSQSSANASGSTGCADTRCR